MFESNQCIITDNGIPLPVDSSEQIVAVFYNVKCMVYSKVVLTTHRIVFVHNAASFFISLKRILSVRKNQIRMVTEDGFLENILVEGECETFLKELEKLLSKITCEIVEDTSDDGILFCNLNQM